jgi:hypothetical protein
MNRHTVLGASAAPRLAADLAGQGHAAAHAPQTSLIVTGLLLGLIGGIVAGLMHRADGASVPAAVVRGGTAFCGVTSLGLVSLLTYAPRVTVALLLSAAAVALVAGVLYTMDGASVPSAVWRAAVAFAGLAGLGPLIVGLYIAPSATSAALAALTGAAG